NAVRARVGTSRGMAGSSAPPRAAFRQFTPVRPRDEPRGVRPGPARPGAGGRPGDWPSAAGADFLRCPPPTPPHAPHRSHPMRRPCAAPACLLSAALLAAGAAARPGRPEGPAQQDEAFAQNLLGAVNQVAEQYVRPVPRAELFYAAVAGLYERARLPVPPRL